MKRRRLILSVALVAVAAAVAVSLPPVYRMAQIASAFSAETACSALLGLDALILEAIGS